jgi:hypothetical protein
VLLDVIVAVCYAVDVDDDYDYDVDCYDDRHWW